MPTKPTRSLAASLPATQAHTSDAGLTRRSLLAGGGAALLAAGMPRSAAGQGKPVPFGAAIEFSHFEADPDYRDLFLRETDLVLPMNALKFGLLRPERERFDFGPADRLVDWALANGKTSRGHAFVWWSTNPDWLEAVEGERETEAVLVEHIERTADHFRGRLASWDVVNEVVAHDPSGADGLLRDTVWLRRLGPRHIPLAFRTAARADPSARLVLNDYDLEFAGTRYDLRRETVLSIVRQLQDAGIRIDAVGIQGHLYAHHRIDVEALARFGRDLAALGVGLLATELDVIDFQVPGTIEERDAAATRVVRDFLDGLFGGTRPEAVIAWGLSDRYSWVDDAMPRGDGTPARPLPFDAALAPKPWHDMLRRRLREA